MANLTRGVKKDPSGTIQKDYWVKGHPGRPRSPKASRTFRQPVEKPTASTDIKAALPLMREYWIPGRAPDPTDKANPMVGRIRSAMGRLDSGLRLAWNPRERLWAIFLRKESIQTDWCKGWKLLFSVKEGFLDARVLSKLYESDTSRFGGAKLVYDKFIAGLATNQVKVDDKIAQNARDWAGEYFDYTMVKSFMPSVKPKGYGTIQQGGKYAKHG